MIGVLSSFLLLIRLSGVNTESTSRCRSVPGDASFPSASQWAALNASISGRLARVVPSAQFCKLASCTQEQFTSAVFRDEIPGAMNQINWEQDYDSVPPSLCTLESPTCGQGDVPLFGVLAESVNDVQTGVTFAKNHNLRLAIKASGHDFLGRSTAKNSILISTHKFQNISFTDSFFVGGENKGSAVTVGSGVPLQTMYQATKAQGKIAVGGDAATVVAAGGYIQGGGHSPLSPTLGLAADNCLELNVVLANGAFIKANEVQNSDLFWAMRGGGAGSWGVIISATFRTFPTFDAAFSKILITANTTASMVAIATIHAQHIFDWDHLRAGQYFYLTSQGLLGIGIPGELTMSITTYFANATIAQANEALSPFITDVLKVAGVALQQDTIQTNINDLLTLPDDSAGFNGVLGSRLVPATTYRNSPESVGEVYSQLLNGGTANILGNLVAGGKVAENANASNAVNPAWRTTKTHMILVNLWDDDATIPEVHSNQTFFLREQLPVLDKLSGPRSAAYSNEADVLEKNFQDVFFGSNYPKLLAIKAKYDPDELFIVRAGVGSEGWDSNGICRV